MHKWGQRWMTKWKEGRSGKDSELEGGGGRKYVRTSPGVYGDVLYYWSEATLAWTRPAADGPSPVARTHVGFAAGPAGGIYLFGGEGPEGMV